MIATNLTWVKILHGLCLRMKCAGVALFVVIGGHLLHPAFPKASFSADMNDSNTS